MGLEHDIDQPPPDGPAPAGPAPGAPGMTDAFRAAIHALYRRYYGRDATEDELTAHAGNPGGIPAVEDALKASNPAGASGGGPQNGDYRGWIMQQLEGQPFNQQTLLDHEAAWKAHGIILQPANAQGERTKVRLPDGTYVRLGFGEGHPVWVVQANPGSGSTPTPAPFTEPGPYPGGDYTPPPLPDDLAHPYTPPTQAELEASAGYGARLEAGRKMRERRAAASGVGLGGGFQKAINRYAQDYASNEYSNYFGQRLDTRNQNYNEYTGSVNRARDTYNTRYGVWGDEQARRRNWQNDYWSRLRDLYTGGQQAAR